MNQRQRKQFGSAGNLTIKGTGFTGNDNTPCYRLQNALMPAASVAKGGGARRTTSTSTTTMTLRKTGSIGNIRALTAASSIPYTKANSKTIGSCPCQYNELEQSAHLHEQYTRNLQQQIYLLELENNYLKHGNEKSSQNYDENEMYCIGAASPLSSPLASRDGTEGRKIFKAGFPEDDKEKQNKGRKRVSYAEPEVTDTSDPIAATCDRKPLSLTSGQAELLHKLEESYQRERKLEERLERKIIEIERIAYENSQLSERIEELESKLQKSEESFARDKRALMEEAVELQRRLDYLTPAIADKESHIAKLENEKDELNDKLRNATNQLSDLQMKMDENNREQKALFDLEGGRKNDVDKLLKTIRRLENTVEEMKNKEASLIDEIAKTKRSLREEQLTAKKDKAVAEKTLEENNILIKENSQLSASLSRLELKIKSLSQVDNAGEKEIKPAEIVEWQEKEKLLKAELIKTQEKLRTEKERNRLISLELEQYQKAEESARESRARMQKELDALKALTESMSNENKSLRQEKFSFSERCEDLLRKGNILTYEITNLTSDMECLKEVNIDLQQKADEKETEISLLQEKIKALQEQNHELLEKLEIQQGELQTCKERCEIAERKQKDMLEQFEKQRTLQQENAEEYEKLAKRVMELSESVKKERRASSSSIATSQSETSKP